MLEFTYNSRNMNGLLYFLLSVAMFLFRVQGLHLNNEDGDIDDDVEKYDWPLNFLYFKNTPPNKLKQIPGNILEISCEVIGKPLPTVKWIVGDYPESELNQQDSNIVVERKDNIYGKVKATHIVDYVLHKPVKYTCVANDGTRTIHASTIVYPSKRHHSRHINSVQQDNIELLHKPRIIYSHLAHFDIIGSTVLLPCRVHAKSAAKVSWLDSRLNRIEENDHFKLLPSGDLLITELQMADIGIYQCIASNAFGIDTAISSVYSLRK